MDRAERLSHQFDIEPGQGVKLGGTPIAAAPDDEAVEEVQTDEIETTDEVSQESAEESQVEETEVTEDEEAQVEDGGLDMSIGQFANAAGVTLKDIYSVTLSDGRTLSQAVDEGNERQAQLQNLQTERNQLQEQLQKAQSAAVQGDAPEVLELELTANLMQQALDNADFSQMEPGQAATYRLDQMNLIAQYRQAAQVKRGEQQVKWHEQMGKSLQEANAVMLGQVKEWVSPDVMASDNKAMGNYLLGRGFTNEELQWIDRTPKFKLLVRDAWKSEAKQAEIKKGAKKVRKISKTLKPGGLKGGTKVGLKEVAQKVKQADTRAGRQAARLSMQFER